MIEFFFGTAEVSHRSSEIKPFSFSRLPTDKVLSNKLQDYEIIRRSRFA